MSRELPFRDQSDCSGESLPWRVTLFYATVPDCVEMIARLSEGLTDDERARAARFVFGKHRHQFVMAHALLHYALWHETRKWGYRFRIDSFGKPHVVSSKGRRDVRFSLSHSGGMTACAISAHDVGIDVEEVKEELDLADIAAAHFTDHEQAQLAAQAGKRRTEIFFRIWTLKEAIVKALGHGLSAPLQDFNFTLRPLKVAIAQGHPDAHCRWLIEQRELSPKHWSAVVVRLHTETNIGVKWQLVTAEEIVSARTRGTQDPRGPLPAKDRG